MFYCFRQNDEVAPHVGVDVGPYCNHDEEWEQGRQDHERFTVPAMGKVDSPYFATQQLAWAMEEVYGDRRDGGNPFRWDRVEFNLPGGDSFRPDRPWVAKVRADGVLAAEIYFYVDDGKATASTAKESWRAMCRATSLLSHLGIQDAPRKRTPGSQTPGAWAGTVLHTDLGCDGLVTQRKWDKMAVCIQELKSLYDSAPEAMPLDRLLSIRGFLIYCARTYRWMRPYMKGLHLTIDSWRPGRDEA